MSVYYFKFSLRSLALVCFCFFLGHVHSVHAQTWGTPIRLENPNGIGGSVGQTSSMAIVNGNPAIAYFDDLHGDLMYRRALDVSGTTWGSAITLDSVGTQGKFPSLKVVNGNPAVSYFDGTNDDLKFIRATDANGTTWSAPLTLDATNSVGQYTSMR